MGGVIKGLVAGIIIGITVSFLIVANYSTQTSNNESISVTIPSESDSSNPPASSSNPSVSQSSTESQSATFTQSSGCSGNARCFTGQVTEIVDGDTIKVDGQSIRFALASTPEVNSPMGVAAKQYVQQICPVGSTVKVDEDDGQTQGSYGRIVGVIYCNGVNLNQAVLEQGFGHMAFSNSFCDKSEFSSKSWSECGGQKTTSSQMQYSNSQYSQTTQSGCDPNYSGACIPINSPDLDCADIGGSVKVSGSDPHGLDRDGDGIGCE